MGPRAVAEGVQGTELLAQAFGFGVQALQQHFGFGRTQVLGGLGLGRAQLLFATGLSPEFLFHDLGFGQAVLLLGRRLGFHDAGVGQAFFLLATGFGNQLLGAYASLGQAFFFLGRCGDFQHAGIGQARRGALGFQAFGQAFLGFGLLGRGFQFGLGQVVDFHRLVLGAGFVGFGLFDLAHQVLLGFGLGLDHHHLLGALGFGDFAHFLDPLFLLGHGLLHRYPLTDHCGDVLALLFQSLFFLDALQFHFTLAGHHFQVLGAGDFLDFDDHRTLAVLLGHFDFALMVLGAHVDFLLGLNACLFGLQALFFLDLGGLGFLAGADGFDLALLPGFGVGLLAFEGQRGFAGLDVLLLDRQFLVALQFVGDDVLRRGQLGDLADTLGVENVARVQGVLGGLLQVVDGHVFQHIAVEVVADDLDDAVAEVLAVLEQLDEVELLAHGLQRFGELGVEQFVDRGAVGGTVDTDGLGHLEHVFLGFIDPQVEGHGDVGAHVVAADQTILGPTVDFQGDQRDAHELLEVDHRVHQGTGEMHLGGRGHVVDNQRRALGNLDIEGLEQGQQAEDHQDDEADPEQDGQQRR